MEKNVRKTLRFSEIEICEIEKELEKIDITFSAYARDLILKNKINTKSKIQKDFLFEVNKIGVNLNQIAKFCNTKKQIPKLKILLKIQKDLEKIIKEKL